MVFIDDQFGLLFLTLIGCVSGFASGLLGIGGGLIAVPALIFALPQLGVSGPEVPKIAMATSLALIVPTSIASAQAHAARGAVDWRMLALLAPNIIAGAFLASLIAPALNARVAVVFFIGFALVTAFGLLRRKKKRAVPETLPATRNTLPVSAALKGAAGGGLSAVLGIGGAFFIIPIVSRFTSMQRAIGTASALAIPLALAGGVGYAFADTPAGCQQGCIGYVFFPAVAAAGISAVTVAPLGAWLTHYSPVVALRSLFAMFLLCAAGHMAYKTFAPAGIGELAGGLRMRMDKTAFR